MATLSGHQALWPRRPQRVSTRPANQGRLTTLSICWSSRGKASRATVPFRLLRRHLLTKRPAPGRTSANKEHTYRAWIACIIDLADTELVVFGICTVDLVDEQPAKNLLRIKVYCIMAKDSSYQVTMASSLVSLATIAVRPFSSSATVQVRNGAEMCVATTCPPVRLSPPSRRPSP